MTTVRREKGSACHLKANEISPEKISQGGGREGGKRVGLLGSPEIYHEVRLNFRFHYDIVHREERKTSKSANVIGECER